MAKVNPFAKNTVKNAPKATSKKPATSKGMPMKKGC